MDWDAPVLGRNGGIGENAKCVGRHPDRPKPDQQDQVTMHLGVSIIFFFFFLVRGGEIRRGEMVRNGMKASPDSG